MFFIQMTVTAQLQVSRPRVDYGENPLGVDAVKPCFSWELQSTQQNVLQAAYRILVSEDSAQLKKNIAAIWDSKKQGSSLSIQIAYAGKPLMATKKYYWKVQVWNNKGTASA